MPQDTAIVQSTQGKTGTAAVAVDPAKSAEDYIKEAEKAYIIPRLVRDKFGDLVKSIYETESMDSEEREYWMQILPIMSDAQLAKLKEILLNEKKQLSQLDKEYRQGASKLSAAPALDEKKRKEKIHEIKRSEEVSEKAEQTQEEELLKKLGEF